MAKNIITRTADFFVSGKLSGGAKVVASNTVDAILAQFTKAVTDLEQLQADKKALIDTNDKQIEQLQKESHEAATEGLRAAKAADKIRALLA